MDRVIRCIAKDIGLNNVDRKEMCRIFNEDDYSAPFPISGSITFAIALVLLDIIEECNLPVQTTLPIALSLVDPQIPPVRAPGSVKRACQRRLKSAKTLHDRIDALYTSKENELGPCCSQLGIDKGWLGDHHQQELPRDAVVSNGVILELYRYLKQHPDLTTADALRWLTRLFPGKEMVSQQVILTDWKRLQAKKNSFTGRKTYLRDAFLAEHYKLPEVRPAAVQSETGVEEPPTSTGESSSTCANINSDIVHMNYESPTKQKLVGIICEQKEIIQELRLQLVQLNMELHEIKSDYDVLLQNEKDVTKDKNLLEYKLGVLEQREETLRTRIENLSYEFDPPRVKKQLKYREKRMDKLNNTITSYKNELEIERKKVEASMNEVSVERHKKRNEQKRVYYYKVKSKPLESMKDGEIQNLLENEKQLRYEIDHLQCQLEECTNDRSVQTFNEGRYVDAVRLVCYDFLSRNVGTQHVAPLIRSVLEKMAGIQVDRLPKATVVKIMALEADILARKQAARALLNTKNATLHTDATTKKDRHYYGFQISTDSGTFSVGMQETVGSDTSTQIEATKELLKELADLIKPDDVDKELRPTEYQMLFNIRNTMTDRGPTSRGWVEGLETWRTAILQDNIMPNLHNLSQESIDRLSTINDFYCGKHFILGLADRAKVGLSLWEDEIASYTGPLGMEKLPEFTKWNCQKPSGLRLIRTASELVGPGAKEPHGIPTLFTDFLDGKKNHIPQFQHNRFNIVFKASSSLYHHRHSIQQLLQNVGSDNKLHKAVLADLGSRVTIAEVRAMGLLEKHVTTPLSTITSKKEHILDMKKYYAHLQNFLKSAVTDPTPIMDGSAIMFVDCPPVKDDIWISLYDKEGNTPEEDALVAQIVSVLCASFLVALERQLQDFLGGKWHVESGDVYEEARTVPRNNDISERDFSGLDRLLRVKNTAKLDFIRGLLLFTHNKTADALHKMSEADLNGELSSAVKLARKLIVTSKERLVKLKHQRLQALKEKREKREAQELNRIRNAQNAVDKVSIDGQQKNAAGVQDLMVKYSTIKDKKDSLKRQLNFYKTLKIQTIPHSKFHFSSGGKEHSVETLMNNLIFVIDMWNTAVNAPPSSSSNPTNQQEINLDTMEETRVRICHLKRKLLQEAEDVRNKKLKKSHAKSMPFPGLELIGKTIKHKYEITTKTGKTMRKWYRGEVLSQASSNELAAASEDDKKLHDEQGHVIFMIHYEDHTSPEAIALQADWENGDVKLENN